jgi:hypothetical protein
MRNIFPVKYDNREGFGLTEQESAALGRDVAAVETGEHLAVTEHGKVEVGRVTL